MTITDTTPAEISTETPRLTAYTFPYSDAVTGIAAVLPHASKDDVTAIITAVNVSPEFFTTTDRYAIGRYAHGAPIAEDLAAIMLPRTAAEWLAKQTVKSLGFGTRDSLIGLRVTITAETIAIHWEGTRDEPLALHRFARLAGNFPPVGRLIDGWEPAADAYPVRLSAEFMARFSTSAAKLDGKAATFIIEFSKPGGYSGDKPGPVRITIGERFSGLLQPNLILK